jgi:hypothetical protein
MSITLSGVEVAVEKDFKAVEHVVVEIGEDIESTVLKAVSAIEGFFKHKAAVAATSTTVAAVSA